MAAVRLDFIIIFYACWFHPLFFHPPFSFFQTEEMKGDRELCTAAVAQNTTALKYASDAMKRNEEICMAAVRRHLKQYPEDKWNLVELNKYGMEHAPAEMKQNKRVREAAGI